MFSTLELCGNGQTLLEEVSKRDVADNKKNWVSTFFQNRLGLFNRSVVKFISIIFNVFVGEFYQAFELFMEVVSFLLG